MTSHLDFPEATPGFAPAASSSDEFRRLARGLSRSRATRSFSKGLRAIAQATAADWKWAGTRVSLCADALEGPPGFRIEIWLETHAPAETRIEVVLELEGRRGTATLARVRSRRLGSQAPSDRDCSKVRLDMTRKSSRKSIVAVLRLLAVARARPWRLAEGIQSVADCLVGAALNQLDDVARAVIRALPRVNAAILMVAADKSATQACVDAFARRLRLKVVERVDQAEGKGTDSIGNLRAIRVDADALDPQAVKTAGEQIELALAYNAVALITTSRAQIPDALRAHVAVTITVPPMHPALFRECFKAAFGTPVPSEVAKAEDSRWTSLVKLNDFCATFRSRLPGELALEWLRTVASRRLQSAIVEHVRPLTSLPGLEPLQEWAETVISELRQVDAGQLSRYDVDRGLLVVGPPGIGKTSWARKTAADGGMPFIATSCAKWQAGSHLGETLRAMQADFARAIALAPSFLFIDEVDAVGNRERLEGPNRQYCIQVIDALLGEMDGFHRRTGVIVIGATNNLADVDPALIRPGRFDRVITVPLPDAATLERIYMEYLGPSIGSDVDLGELARLSAGRSGADVELIVRGARRRAAREDRIITMGDLRAVLIEVTLGPVWQGPEQGIDELRRIAVHEAGHALMQLVGPDRGRALLMVSVIRRGMGAGVTKLDMRNHFDRERLLDTIRTMLAGEAAEEVIYGENGISMGSGGTEYSDRARATMYATLLETTFGVGSERDFVWRGTVSHPQQAAAMLRTNKILDDRVSELLRREYLATMERIRANRPLLDEIVALLLAEREVDGGRLRQLVFNRSPV